MRSVAMGADNRFNSASSVPGKQLFVKFLEDGGAKLDDSVVEYLSKTFLQEALHPSKAINVKEIANVLHSLAPTIDLDGLEDRIVSLFEKMRGESQSADSHVENPKNLETAADSVDDDWSKGPLPCGSPKASSKPGEIPEIAAREPANTDQLSLGSIMASMKADQLFPPRFQWDGASHSSFGTGGSSSSSVRTSHEDGITPTKEQKMILESSLDSSLRNGLVSSPGSPRASLELPKVPLEQQENGNQGKKSELDEECEARDKVGFIPQSMSPMLDKYSMYSSRPDLSRSFAELSISGRMPSIGASSSSGGNDEHDMALRRSLDSMLGFGKVSLNPRAAEFVPTDEAPRLPEIQGLYPTRDSQFSREFSSSLDSVSEDDFRRRIREQLPDELVGGFSDLDSRLEPDFGGYVPLRVSSEGLQRPRDPSMQNLQPGMRSSHHLDLLQRRAPSPPPPGAPGHHSWMGSGSVRMPGVGPQVGPFGGRVRHPSPPPMGGLSPPMAGRFPGRYRGDRPQFEPEPLGRVPPPQFQLPPGAMDFPQGPDLRPGFRMRDVGSLDEQIAFLAGEFPNFSTDNLADIFLGNNGDMNRTIDMLTQLELQEDASRSPRHPRFPPPTPPLTMMDFPSLSGDMGPPMPPVMPLNSPRHRMRHLEEDYRAGAPDFAAAVRKPVPMPPPAWQPFDRRDEGFRRRPPPPGPFGAEPLPRNIPRGPPQPWLETGHALANLYADLREEAEDHARVRGICLEQATQAFMAGNKALAKELSAKGRWHDEQMVVANSKASEAMFRQRNMASGYLPRGGPMQGGPGPQPPLLDLHGLHINEAIPILKRELSGIRAMARGSGQRQQVFICVGTGHHTKGRARLPIAVERYLVEEERVDFTETQPGMYRVVL